VEPTGKHIQVILNGAVVAGTRRAQRVLETSHPPAYYIPPEDIRMEFLTRTSQATWCEWKGQAAYYSIEVGNRVVANAAWSYPHPAPGYVAIQDHIVFYPHLMDACAVDGERVQPQLGAFYGGWITRDIVGPFKGEAGSWGW
jgi:uncharacterized protein (DUF427 family)